MGELRFTYQTLRVLKMFLDDPKSELTGAEVVRQSKVASGTVYPLLLRFERLGFLESHWEAGDPRELGHPRRRYYRITRHGIAAIQEPLRELGFLAEVRDAEGV